MICMACGSRMGVKDTRTKGGRVHRVRRCDECGNESQTIEVDMDDVIVTQGSGIGGLLRNVAKRLARLEARALVEEVDDDDG